MFVDKNEILKLLNDGMDSEEIAQTLINTLNEALQEKKDVDEAAEKERQAKVESANILLTAFNDYVNDWCPTIAKEIQDNESLVPNDIIEIMEEMEHTMTHSKEALNDLAEALDKAMEFLTSDNPKVKTDNIVKFLKENHL